MWGFALEMTTVFLTVWQDEKESFLEVGKEKKRGFCGRNCEVVLKFTSVFFWIIFGKISDVNNGRFLKKEFYFVVSKKGGKVIFQELLKRLKKTILLSAKKSISFVEKILKIFVQFFFFLNKTNRVKKRIASKNFLDWGWLWK